MKVLTVVLYVLCCHSALMAQEGRRIENQAMLFQLPLENDTVEFVVVDTLLQQKKPLLLWCQGSLPMPLFLEMKDRSMYFFGGGVSNFDYKKIAAEYYLVVVSMPKTPVFGYRANLNEDYQYVRSKEIPYDFLPEYVAADYLDNYVRRADAVLHFLRAKKWVSKNKLVVAGHSQGSKVAAKLALHNPHVTHLGLFAANPFGRVDERIRRARADAESGKISWMAADSIMNAAYDEFRWAHNPKALAQHPALLATKTFSETFYDDWLQLNIPIYLAYGARDQTAELCDLVPLFFIQQGKTNLTMKRYLELEHNFFETNAAGRTDYEKPHWEDVMQAFLDWIK